MEFQSHNKRSILVKSYFKEILQLVVICFILYLFREEIIIKYFVQILSILIFVFIYYNIKKSDMKIFKIIFLDNHLTVVYFDFFLRRKIKKIKYQNLVYTYRYKIYRKRNPKTIEFYKLDKYEFEIRMKYSGFTDKQFEKVLEYLNNVGKEKKHENSIA